MSIGPNAGAAGDHAANPTARALNRLETLLKSGEDWLMERILRYAIDQGYAAYTSTLKEPWRLSVSGLSTSILEGIRHYGDIPEMTPEDDFAEDPVTVFGTAEAQRHRERGVSMKMFLGLMKYYRQAYIDMLEECLFPDDAAICRRFVHRVFDRIEISFCAEWSGGNEDGHIHDLQVSNRLMTNEKNKYLTIFESIPNPVILLNRVGRIDNMNIAAANLFRTDLCPGSQYYCLTRDRQLEMAQCVDDEDASRDPACFGGEVVFQRFPWLESEIGRFHASGADSFAFEKGTAVDGENVVFRVKFSKSLDISGKFDGTVIILEDITSLKNALAEVKTLRGFVPICMHCKSIRDDAGFWQKVEKYVSEHSEAVFSHSLCPDCAAKHYPDMRLYAKKTTCGVE